MKRLKVIINKVYLMKIHNNLHIIIFSFINFPETKNLSNNENMINIFVIVTMEEKYSGQIFFKKHT